MGSSVNFYSRELRQWRQLWVSAGTIIDVSGNLEGGFMVLVGSNQLSGIGCDTSVSRTLVTPGGWQCAPVLRGATPG